MKLVKILGTIFALATLTASARTQERPPNRENLRNESIILCGDGLTGGDCELSRGIMRLALSNLSSSIPEWRFVIVPESRWQEAADRFGVKRTTPAFSSLDIRTTYVERNLLSQDARIDENFQRFTGSNGARRLVWVMAHEYGHILCQTSDERKASEAAGRLIYGRGQVCR
jgi:hypothetical protein